MHSPYTVVDLSSVHFPRRSEQYLRRNYLSFSPSTGKSNSSAFPPACIVPWLAVQFIGLHRIFFFLHFILHRLIVFNLVPYFISPIFYRRREIKNLWQMYEQHPCCPPLAGLFCRSLDLNWCLNGQAGELYKSMCAARKNSFASTPKLHGIFVFFIFFKYCCWSPACELRLETHKYPNGEYFSTFFPLPHFRHFHWVGDIEAETCSSLVFQSPSLRCQYCTYMCKHNIHGAHTIYITRIGWIYMYALLRPVYTARDTSIESEREEKRHTEGPLASRGGPADNAGMSRSLDPRISTTRLLFFCAHKKGSSNFDLLAFLFDSSVDRPGGSAYLHFSP